jgi:hypothetical protein
MRVTALILLGIALAISSPAHAEKVKTNQPAKLYSHPGEHGSVLLKVKSGQNMTVLAKEGRWLKVRVQGRTGYIPRSKVDLPESDEIVRNTRRRPFVDGRSTRRGFGGDQGPDDRVGADATGDVASSAGGDDDDEDDDGGKKKKHGDDDEDDDGGKKASKKHGDDSDDDDDGEKVASSKKHGDDDEDSDDSEPDDSQTEDPPEEDDRPRAHVGSKTKVFTERDKDSDTEFVARPGDVLYPEETKGKWTFVSNDDGEAGWILASSLEDDGGGGGSGKRSIDVRARLGLTFIQQGMRSQGSTFMGTGFNPDNYNLGTSALTLNLGGSYYRPYSKDYIIGGEFAYTYGKTVFGGVFADVDGNGGQPGVNIGLALHQVDLRLAAGKDFHKPSGLAVFARLGFRYQGFLIDNVTDMAKNPAKLPSEVMKAPTIGAAIAIPHLSGKLGLKAWLDGIIAGASVTQTTGLEDGKSASVKAACVGATVTYKWKKDMDLQAGYELDLTSVDFGAPVAGNARGHTGSDVSRKDYFHILTFGITRGF